MLNIKDGIATRRYWKSMFQVQRENAAAANRDTLRAALRTLRPGIEANLAELSRDGVTAIAEYWPSQRCAEARAELDALMRSEPGCVRRFSGDSDKRVFGAEVAGQTIRGFHQDQFLQSVGEIAGGFSLYNFATLGARIDATEDNRGSGDGWHRDAFGFQFKAIVYLSDVSDENGPFEYVCGSQKMWQASLDTALGRAAAPPDSRIDFETMNRLIAKGAIKPRRFTAKAGTVILANTAGIHGGARLRSGHRYALTNYYYFPYQIGKTLVEKFEPLAPGVKERLAPFIEAERAAQNANARRETDHA